jgi:phosphoglycolate phosphatase
LRVRYRLLAWDFDGTLADSLASSLAIYNSLAARHGFRPVEDGEAVRGLSLRTFLRRHGIPLWKLPVLISDFLAAQKGEIEKIRLFPGLSAVLHELSRRGLAQAVLSSNSRDNISACLRANDVEAIFASVVGYRRLFGKGKALRRLVKAQGVAGRDVLYLGDEVRDIEAARQAGTAVAAVTWGLNTREFLAGNHPDHLIERPEEVLDLL